MAESVIHSSFAAGEISPNLFARVDLDKYHVGAALMRNFIVDYRGGATSRAGFEFLAQARGQGFPPGTPGINVRVIPFSVSTDQTYVIELGTFYMRFYSNGSQVTEAPFTITNITMGFPPVVTAPGHNFVDNDEVFIAGVKGMYQINDGNYAVHSADQSAGTFELEFLDGSFLNTTGFNPYTSAGTVTRIYTLTTPYDGFDVLALKYVQSADVLTLTLQNTVPHNLTRTDVSTFSLDPIETGPVVDPPTSLTVTTSQAGNLQYGYVVTNISVDGREESLQSPSEVIDSKALDPLNASPVTVLVRWSQPSLAGSSIIYKWGPVPDDQPRNSIYGFIGTAVGNSFVDNNIAPDFSRGPPQFFDPFSPGQILSIQITSAGTGLAANAQIALTFTGNGTGAVGYVLTDASGAAVSAFVLYGGTAYTHVAVSGAGATTFVTTLAPISGTYPSCVTYFQQRRCFGGSISAPETLVMSQTGNYENFDTSPSVLDTDAITISLASREVNAIKHMVPMPAGLVVFTTGGAFQITGGSPGSPITPTTITATPQSSNGANDLQPIVVNYNILYVQAKGSIVRDLAYNFYVQTYTGLDRSALANHLFFGYQLVDWAWVEEPFKAIWVARNDGKALALTYVPEQEVYGWSQHDTQGLFSSFCSISENNENVLYAVVRRYIQGSWHTYIERMVSRKFVAAEDAWCVDCALQYPLNPQGPTAVLTILLQDDGTARLEVTSGVFTSDMANTTVVWTAGGKFTITALFDPFTAIATIDVPPTDIIPDLAETVVVPQVGWYLIRITSRVYGLIHLIGQTVTGLADGQVITPRVVQQDGSVILDNPATKIVIGLAFQAQLQTLYLDVGEPTIQGKRKRIAAITARLDLTRGLKYGIDFDNLSESDNFPIPPDGIPSPLITDDDRTIPFSDWNTKAQICLQQDYPLPATVLGVITEVTFGDNQR